MPAIRALTTWCATWNALRRVSPTASQSRATRSPFRADAFPRIELAAMKTERPNRALGAFRALASAGRIDLVFRFTGALGPVGPAGGGHDVEKERQDETVAAIGRVAGTGSQQLDGATDVPGENRQERQIAVSPDKGLEGVIVEQRERLFAEAFGVVE